MLDYICGTCKYYKPDEYYCRLHEAPYYSKWDTCDDWTDDSEGELTDEEKDAIEGDIEAHRFMIEGRKIE